MLIAYVCKYASKHICIYTFNVTSQIRAVLQELAERNRSGPTYEHHPVDDDGNIDMNLLVCNLCGSGDDSEGNDIVACDNVGCFRAYHTLCLKPAVAPEVFSEADMDDQVCYCKYFRCSDVSSVFIRT